MKKKVALKRYQGFNLDAYLNAHVPKQTSFPYFQHHFDVEIAVLFDREETELRQTIWASDVV